MATAAIVKRAKPTSSGRRQLVMVERKTAKHGPNKKLITSKPKRGSGNGRNNAGRITVRHHGVDIKNAFESSI